MSVSRASAAGLSRERTGELIDHIYAADPRLRVAHEVRVRREAAKMTRKNRPIDLNAKIAAIDIGHLAGVAVLNGLQGRVSAEGAFVQSRTHGVRGTWHALLKWHWAHELRHPVIASATLGSIVYLGTEALAQCVLFGGIARPERLVAAALMMAPTIICLQKFLTWVADRHLTKSAGVAHTSALATLPPRSLRDTWRAVHERKPARSLIGAPRQLGEWVASSLKFVGTACAERKNEWKRVGWRTGVFAPLWAISYMFGMEGASAIAGHGFSIARWLGAAGETWAVAGALVPVEYHIQNRVRQQFKYPATMLRSIVWGLATSFWNLGSGTSAATVADAADDDEDPDVSLDDVTDATAADPATDMP